MKSVSNDVARQEVEKWLSAKRISAKKREANEDSIENLVEGFEEGVLVLNHETNEITQNILFPEGEIKQLVFKPRMSVGDLHPYLKQLKSNDVDGRVKAYISALTNQPASILNRLDLYDYGVSTNIAVFFF